MRGAAMVEYRWCLIGTDDKVRGVEYAECPSDADAMMRAEQLFSQRRDLGGVEVWAMETKRLVGRAPRAEAEHERPIMPRDYYERSAEAMVERRYDHQCDRASDGDSDERILHWLRFGGGSDFDAPFSAARDR